VRRGRERGILISFGSVIDTKVMASKCPRIQTTNMEELYNVVCKSPYEVPFIGIFFCSFFACVFFLAFYKDWIRVFEHIWAALDFMKLGMFIIIFWLTAT
jgi:hypothetical protein